MRVLVVHNRYRSAFPSGENSVVDDETVLLADAGCEVERLEVESDEIADWGALRKAALPARIVWSRSGSRLVAGAAARFRPDIVHLHNTFPLLSPSALWAARRSGAGVVATLHNFRPLSPSGLLEGGLYRDSRVATAPVAAMIGVHRLLGTWRRCPHAIVVPSETARAHYVAAGWPAERIVVKYNAVPPAAVRRAGPGDGFVCVARLTREKGVDILLEAWRLAFQDGGPSLAVIGSGSEEPSLRRAAKSLCGVDFVGQLPQEAVAQRVAGARALVVPSRCAETFARVAVEAFATGVPVVAARAGALGEFVHDGVNGMLVAPEDPRALARALRRLHDAPALSERFGAGAEESYRLMFGGGGPIERLLDVYRYALARAA